MKHHLFLSFSLLCSHLTVHGYESYGSQTASLLSLTAMLNHLIYLSLACRLCENPPKIIKTNMKESFFFFLWKKNKGRYVKLQTASIRKNQHQPVLVAAPTQHMPSFPVHESRWPSSNVGLIWVNLFTRTLLNPACACVLYINQLTALPCFRCVMCTDGAVCKQSITLW